MKSLSTSLIPGNTSGFEWYLQTLKLALAQPLQKVGKVQSILEKVSDYDVNLSLNALDVF